MTETKKAVTLLGGDRVMVDGEPWTLADVQVELPGPGVTLVADDGRRWGPLAPDSEIVLVPPVPGLL